MKIISFLTRYSRGAVALAIAAGIISGACNTLLLAVITKALSGAASPVPRIGWIFASLCILLPLTRFASEALLARVGQDALLDLRMRISRKITATPLAKLEELGSHRLLAMLTDDVPMITNAVAIIPMIAINAAVVAGGLIYLAMLSRQIFLAALGFIALGVLIYQIPVIKAIRFLRGGREVADTLVKHFRAVTEGTKELKLHRNRRENFFSKALLPTAVSYRKQNLAGMLIFSGAGSCGQGLVFAVIGLTIFALPHLEAVSLHTVTAYTLIFLYLAGPIQSLMNLLPTLGRAEVAIRKVEGLGTTLAADADHTEATPRTDPGQEWQSLELDGVTHQYRGAGEFESFRLGPIDLTVSPGELIFLVGGNGSGKTTLAKLITGLYIPETGKIRVGDRTVTDESRDNYRQHFAAVFSDFFLFETLLGLKTAKIDEEARRLLIKLQLDQKVRVSDGVLSTTELSSGQRKRLALLTAYLEDRPIYVFDEWASDQDPVFRMVFYADILPTLKARGKAVIAITHDEDYYHLADRIIRVTGGRIESDKYNNALEAVR